MKGETRKAMLEAMLEQLSQRGYEEASVRAAARAAGVDEAEVGIEFADKDACLFAAYELLGEKLMARTTGGCDRQISWPERVRFGLAKLLGEIAANPAMAEVAVRSFPAIRPAAYQRYVDLLEMFLPFVKEGRRYSGIEEQLPGEVELLAVGAAEAIIFSELDAGRADRLPRMLPEILFSILVPFIGPERAGEEMKTAAAAL